MLLRSVLHRFFTMNAMVWLYSILFDLVFLAILLVFHPLLALAGVISRELFWRIFIVMNRALVWNLRICGRTTIIVSGVENIPHSERPVLVIANHQSMFDIPLLITTFWPRQTRFIAKKELARGVPSVSIGLRLSQAALINRSDRRQAIHEIRAFSQSVGEANGTACIFPEGTRAKSGVMKPFKPIGAATFLKQVPHALVCPVAIHGSWFIVRRALWPFEARQTVRITILPPIEAGSIEPQGLVAMCEAQIAPLVRDERAVQELEQEDSTGNQVANEEVGDPVIGISTH